MGQNTLIAWTDHTFNLVWGCVKVSPGCANCYALTLANRYGHDVWGKGKPRRTFGVKYWGQPDDWNGEAETEGRRRRCFCGSMCDWAEDHPTVEAERAKLWDAIRRTPWLDWLLLTKRPERIRQCLPADWGDGYGNVWLGTSIENDDYAWRADHLRTIPATVRFISYEPALGPVPSLDLTGIDWLIYGGESGPGYRQHNPQWARDVMAKCLSSGTAFFFKQSSAPRTEMGIELDGQVIRNYPTPRLPVPACSILAQ